MFPVILTGRDYWDELVRWLQARMMREHVYIDADDLNVFTMADDVHTAVKIIRDFKEGPGRSGIILPNGMEKA